MSRITKSMDTVMAKKIIARGVAIKEARESNNLGALNKLGVYLTKTELKSIQSTLNRLKEVL